MKFSSPSPVHSGFPKPFVHRRGTTEKLKTLTLKEEEEEQQTTTTTTISFPNEIIQEILSRLPIKPILQFTSVSKQWLSLISHDPSFPKLHFTRSLATKRTALFIIAYDSVTEERHLISAPPDGGPVTHLFTINNVHGDSIVEAQHLNGLVLCTCNITRIFNFALVVNPSTHKVFKLPHPTGFVEAQHLNWFVRCINFFGFHRSRNEHYVLSIRKYFPKTTNFKFGKSIDMTDIKPNAIEFMIYSLSTYSWRKIEVDEEKFPLDITGNPWFSVSITSLCVNSVIHLMLITCNKILAFDLTTNKFSTIDIPRDAIPHEGYTRWFFNSIGGTSKGNHPYLMDINGCLGLVCHDRVVERNEIYFWILQDYDSCVWVKETATFSESWIDLNCDYLVDPVFDMDKIVFSARWLSRDEVAVPIYDMKTKGLKFVQFTLGQQFLHSKIMEFGEVTSYVESILPLENNEEGLHE